MPSSMKNSKVYKLSIPENAWMDSGFVPREWLSGFVLSWACLQDWAHKSIHKVEKVKRLWIYKLGVCLGIG
ncbi:MAG: hypothetical protein HW380_2729 [Magnetococcales bacterium]|nr:hypothetical protein [Magnetococcales bacterium]